MNLGMEGVIGGRLWVWSGDMGFLCFIWKGGMDMGLGWWGWWNMGVWEVGDGLLWGGWLCFGVVWVCKEVFRF